MKFETKFDKGDRAWYMKDNKPLEVVISAIYIFFVGTNQDSIKYSARDMRNSVSWLDHQNLFEDDLFRSKAELLESLFGDKACKGKNCHAIDGVGHSEDCEQEHNQCHCDSANEITGLEGTRKVLDNLGS